MAILRLSVMYSLLFLQFQAQTLGKTPIQYLVEWITATEKFVDSALVFIKNESKYLNKNLEPALDQFVNYTSSVIDSIWNNIESELNSINQTTDPDLQLIIDCIIVNRDSIKAVPLGLFSEVARCVSGNTVPITNVTQFICSGLQRVQKEVKAAAGQLKRCTGSIEKVLNCTVNVAHNVSKALEKLPTEVGEDWSFLVHSIESLEESYDYCQEFNVADAHKKYIKVFENISTCIVNSAANQSNHDDFPDQSRAALLGDEVPPVILLAMVLVAILNEFM